MKRKTKITDAIDSSARSNGDDSGEVRSHTLTAESAACLQTVRGKLAHGTVKLSVPSFSP